jgi:hypothetical protein
VNVLRAITGSAMPRNRRSFACAVVSGAAFLWLLSAMLIALALRESRGGGFERDVGKASR